jgi:hypothetical protein
MARAKDEDEGERAFKITESKFEFLLRVYCCTALSFRKDD